MGLVDYDSDSGSSDSEAASTVKSAAPAAPAAPTTSTGKKPFQKLTSNGKIVVNLPSTAAATSGEDDSEQRPAKRARMAGAGGGTSRFSGFASFLPPPKKTAATAAPGVSSSSSAASGTARSAGTLKTSGDVAFRRSSDDADASTSATANEGSGDKSSSRPSTTLSLPPPKGPRVADGQKAAEDVKLVGSATMFVPLSVSRRPGKKPKKTGTANTSSTATAASTSAATPAASTWTEEQKQQQQKQEKPKKKVSLFSLEATTQSSTVADGNDDDDDGGGDDNYQPLFDPYKQPQDDEAQVLETPPAQPNATATTAPASASLGALADELKLSARERRELFGRGGRAEAAAAATQIAATFDMDKEYRHNEALRQAGEQDAQAQAHNPVRAVQPGKHSLRQLVSAVQGQQEAFEETFAKNRAAQRESGGRYGWR